jgi:protein CpxP
MGNREGTLRHGIQNDRRHRILARQHNFLLAFDVYLNRQRVRDGFATSDRKRRASSRKDLKMTRRTYLTRINTGVALLGMVLCVPAAMLAQDTTPPSQDSQATPGQQASPGEQPMHHHQPPSAERQLQHLTKMLNLTPDQQQKMLPILQDQQKQMGTIQSNTALSSQERHQQMRAATMDTHQKLEANMTDTQKQQFEQAMQQRHDRMKNGGAGAGADDGAGAPPPPPDGQNAPPPDGQNAPPPPPQQ